jgi:hypothetical protein
LTWDAQLELLGGPEAVAQRMPMELDPEALGFSERECELLDAIDGATGIETLVVSSRLKTDRGYQVLAVAKVLGLIAVRPDALHQPGDVGDAQLLEARYDQAQQSDYFAILGVSRTATGAEVVAAAEQLRKQFDPLKFAASADAGLLRRAQVVYRLIEEAARTLQDDHLRAEYARHLV